MLIARKGDAIFENADGEEMEEKPDLAVASMLLNKKM
jgi:hypothetical protein